MISDLFFSNKNAGHNEHAGSKRILSVRKMVGDKKKKQR